MPLIQVPFKPGIDKQLTETGAQGRWIDSDNVRFRYGLPEKIGGWTKVITNALIGAPRAQQPFSSLDSENFDFVATNKKQYIYQKTDNSINDVSPQRYGAYGTTAVAKSLTSAFDTNATTYRDSELDCSWSWCRGLCNLCVSNRSHRSRLCGC